MAEVEAGDGVRLYAEAHGSGPPVLFSCALNTTHVNWCPQVEPLVAAGFRVVLWDYRGHGRSQVPAEESAYTIEKVVDDLGRVLDWAAPGEPAVLAGLSFGGLASLHFALTHPERVRALVLVASGPGFKNPKAQAAWQASIERTAGFIESRGLAALVERAGAVTVGRRPELPTARAAAEAIAAQDPKGVATFARRISGPAPPVIDRLAEIQVPALVVVGGDDADYQRAADVMEAKLPAAERVDLPGVGHMLNIEAADAFVAALLPFLERMRSR
jgi:pimeloyl-ACP methyl ester carboxylesterase